jgi:hypothetical protein
MVMGNDGSENFSANSIASLMTDRQKALGLDDAQLADALGYSRGNVIALIRSGVMKLPVNKIRALGEALQVDPAVVLTAVLREQLPALLDVIMDVIGPLKLTETERRLLVHLRALPGGGESKPVVLDGAKVVALIVA